MTYENPQVAFVNQSSVLTDPEVDVIRRALSYQVEYQFAPYWRTGARTISVPKGTTPPPGSWQVIFKDDSDQPGALGYHDISGAFPLAYVFARTCATDGVSASSCASHELLEMLADPRIDRCVQVGSSTFYAYEVGDPVEQSGYIVTVKDAGGLSHSVEVSDFVYPNWFDKGSAGPWDHLVKLTSPLQLEPGGSYIGRWTPTSGWGQVNADGTSSLAPDPDDRRRCLRPFQRGLPR